MTRSKYLVIQVLDAGFLYSDLERFVSRASNKEAQRVLNKTVDNLDKDKALRKVNQLPSLNF